MDDRLLNQVNHFFKLMQRQTAEEFAPLIFDANYLRDNSFTSKKPTKEELDTYMNGYKRLRELKKEYYDKNVKNNIESNIKDKTNGMNKIIANIENVYQVELTKKLAFYDLDISFSEENQRIDLDLYSDEYYQYRKAFNKLVDWYRFKYGNIYVDNYCKEFCYYIKELYNLENLENDYAFRQAYNEAGYFSPDYSTIVYYGRSPYIRQVILAKRDGENEYHKWLKRFEEDGILFETFAHRFG